MPKYIYPFHYDVDEDIIVEAENPIQAAAAFEEKLSAMRKAAWREYDAASIEDYGEAVTHRTNTVACAKFDTNQRFFDEEYRQYDNSGLPIPDEAEDEAEEDTTESTFVFGILSGDDLSDAECASEATMNDLDIIYRNGEYFASIEEIYSFETPEDRHQYLKSLEQQFRSYLLDLGIPEERLDDLKRCSAFEKHYMTEIISDIMPLKARTLVDLYYKFALFVKIEEAIQGE